MCFNISYGLLIGFGSIQTADASLMDGLLEISFLSHEMVIQS
jgi:hypothetical protein